MKYDNERIKASHYSTRRPVNQSNDALISIVENSPYLANIKKAGTGTYLANNTIFASQLSATSSQNMAGMTVHDLRLFVQPDGVPHADWITQFDTQVCKQKSAVVKIYPCLLNNGDARYLEATKLPILGSQQKILLIATFAQDLTFTLNPSEVYELYRHFYDARAAIKRALAHLGIEKCFVILPTEAPFRIFLAKAERYSNKQIAQRLGLSHRTVDYQVTALNHLIADGNVHRAISLIKQPRRANQGRAPWVEITR
jgi:hypothetical protein